MSLADLITFFLAFLSSHLWLLSPADCRLVELQTPGGALQEHSSTFGCLAWLFFYISSEKWQYFSSSVCILAGTSTFFEQMLQCCFCRQTDKCLNWQCCRKPWWGGLKPLFAFARGKTKKRGLQIRVNLDESGTNSVEIRIDFKFWPPFFFLS